MNEHKVQQILGFKKPYLEYLQKRMQGLSAIRSMQEVNQEVREAKKYKLRCLWHQLGFQTPPCMVMSSFDTKLNTKAWQQHSTFNLQGENMVTCFSPTDRLRLMFDILSRQIDLVHLLQCGYVADFAPLEDTALKRASFMPLKRLLVESCDEAMALPFRSRYFGDKASSKRKSTMFLGDAKSHQGYNDLKEEKPLEKKKGKSGLRTIFQNRMEHLYFGPKIGLYFIFLRHYTKWMLWPAVFGVGFQIAHFLLPQSAGEGIVIANAIFLTIWAPQWLASWKETETRKLLQRGQQLDTAHVVYQEPVRIPFKGVQRRSPETGEEGDLFFSPFKQFLRYFASTTFTVFAFTVVLAVVVAISSARVFLFEYCWLNDIISGAPEFNFSQNIVGGANAVQIFVFNALYSKMALWLTHWENHKTYSQFQKLYIVKTIVFQFINSYSTLFYIAFFKIPVEEHLGYPGGFGCPKDGKNCVMGLLNIQLRPCSS